MSASEIHMISPYFLFLSTTYLFILYFSCNFQNIHSDIALLKVSENFDFSSQHDISPICLPNPGKAQSEILNKTSAECWFGMTILFFLNVENISSAPSLSELKIFAFSGIGALGVWKSISWAQTFPFFQKKSTLSVSHQYSII